MRNRVSLNQSMYKNLIKKYTPNFIVFQQPSHNQQGVHPEKEIYL